MIIFQFFFKMRHQWFPISRPLLCDDHRSITRTGQMTQLKSEVLTTVGSETRRRNNSRLWDVIHQVKNKNFLFK